ncbi:hypothetical protein ACFQEX_15565 [Roseibium salinum]|uniref:hypothetical protein n=1 Tax=Roseibium salinum TaxID=1604349 RepID=UPI003607991B
MFLLISTSPAFQPQQSVANRLPVGPRNLREFTLDQTLARQQPLSLNGVHHDGKDALFCLRPAFSSDLRAGGLRNGEYFTGTSSFLSHHNMSGRDFCQQSVLIPCLSVLCHITCNMAADFIPLSEHLSREHCGNRSGSGQDHQVFWSRLLDAWEKCSPSGGHLD